MFVSLLEYKVYQKERAEIIVGTAEALQSKAKRGFTITRNPLAKFLASLGRLEGLLERPHLAARCFRSQVR